MKQTFVEVEFEVPMEAVLVCPTNVVKPEPNSLRLLLYHKPRGSKGKFFEVEKGIKIRVSKAVGKKLRLICLTEFEYDKNTPHLSLMEAAEGNEDSFVPSRFKMEIDVKKNFLF